MSETRLSEDVDLNIKKVFLREVVLELGSDKEIRVWLRWRR